jgi:Kdo2-lipid IVA lauroyltransferase/acyltransferase
VPGGVSRLASLVTTWLGTALAWFVGRALAVRRAHVVASMRRAGVSNAERTASAMYGSLGRGLFEFLWMALTPRSALPAWVSIDAATAEHMDRIAARGAVVASAHTGNWDLLACAAAARWPLTLVTKQLSVRTLNCIWQAARSRRGIRLVSAGNAAREGARALARRELVVMLIDQAPERKRATVVTEFLGQPARVDLAPALLALRARVPLVAVFARRAGDGCCVAELGPAIVPPERPSRRWAEESMIALTRALEAFVRRNPDQWLWMHRRWKDAPDDAVLTLPADGRAGRRAA